MGIKQPVRKMKARRPITRRTKESDSTPNLNRNGQGSCLTEDAENKGGGGRKTGGGGGYLHPPPSIPGALQCIHHEWSKYEMERSKWAADKAELEAKIAFLRGQRKGQEKLVRDLVCRVKMLEYSLREERAKYDRLKHNTEPAGAAAVVEEKAPPPATPEGGATAPEGEEEERFTPPHDWRRGRHLLRQYLSEIGYTEAVVDINSYRVNALLRLYDRQTRGGGMGGGAAADEGHASKSTTTEVGAAQKASERPFATPVADSEVDILGKFAFFPVQEDEENEDRYALGGGRCPGYDPATPAAAAASRWGESWPVDRSEETLGDLARLEGVCEPCADEQMTWRIKYMLRGHYDSVRSLAFHPVEPLLATASEDHTVALWNLEDTSSASPCEDLSPGHTFRGHTGPAMCVAVSPNGKWVVSGGLDGTLLCWELPDNQLKRLKEDGAVRDVAVRLDGHTDIVWGLSHQVYGGRTTLLSCSSDGSVRLWAPEESLVHVSSFCSQDGECPTSVDFSRTEPNRMATAYDTGECVLYDLEYGKPLVWLDTPKDHGRINRVVTHPVMPATITACEDGCVRFYDDTTGRLVHTMSGHRDSVSSLAIDRYGMYMLTGGHDRTVCVWDVRARRRTQQIHAHGGGGRGGESVLDVAFHQTRPLVASAGADGCAQVLRPL